MNKGSTPSGSHNMGAVTRNLDFFGSFWSLLGARRRGADAAAPHLGIKLQRLSTGAKGSFG